MTIKNKRTGKVVCLDAVGEMAAVIAIVVITVVTFRPLMTWMLEVFLAINGGR